MQILFAAKKYMIDNLTVHCKQFIERILKSHNVCEILEHCFFFSEDDLISECMSIIASAPEAAFESESFKSLSNSTLLKVLDMEELNCPEMTIFEAAIAWAKHNSGVNSPKVSDLRRILGEALYKIRFPIMPQEDLTHCIDMYPEILTLEEQVLCYRVMGGSTHYPPSFPFKAQPRKATDHTLFREGLNNNPLQMENIGNIKISFIIINESVFPVDIMGFYFTQPDGMTFQLFEYTIHTQQEHSLFGSAVDTTSFMRVDTNPIPTMEAKFNGVPYTLMKLAKSRVCQPKQSMKYQYYYSTSEQRMSFGGSTLNRRTLAGIQGIEFTFQKYDIKLHGKVTDIVPDSTLPLGSHQPQINNTLYSHIAGIVCKKVNSESILCYTSCD